MMIDWRTLHVSFKEPCINRNSTDERIHVPLVVSISSGRHLSVETRLLETAALKAHIEKLLAPATLMDCWQISAETRDAVAEVKRERASPRRHTDESPFRSQQWPLASQLACAILEGSKVLQDDEIPKIRWSDDLEQHKPSRKYSDLWELRTRCKLYGRFISHRLRQNAILKSFLCLANGTNLESKEENQSYDKITKILVSVTDSLSKAQGKTAYNVCAALAASTDETFELCLRAARRTNKVDLDLIAKKLSETLLRQDHLRYWTCVQPHWWWDSAEIIATAQSSHVDATLALGSVALKPSGKRKHREMRSRSRKRPPSTCPSYRTFKSTSDEAPSGFQDPPRCAPPLPRPVVDTVRQHDCSKVPKHQSHTSPSHGSIDRDTSEVKSIEDAFWAPSDHPSPEDEMGSIRVESPNNHTGEAVRHQDDSDELFEAESYISDSSDPIATVASRPSLVQYAGHDARSPDTRSTSPVARIQMGMQTTFASQQNTGDEEERLDRQSQACKSEARTLRRRRCPHDTGPIVVKRKRIV